MKNTTPEIKYERIESELSQNLLDVFKDESTVYGCGKCGVVQRRGVYLEISVTS